MAELSVANLRPEVSLGLGLATATLVYGIYTNALPTLADIRSGEPMNGDIQAAEKAAAWASAGTVAFISIIARDPNIFILGGGMLLVLSWLHKHANIVDPESGKASNAMAAQVNGMYSEVESAANSGY